eukprot:TRINITY_DN2610_c0_g3_i1.p1 TRINITY_DN2610_c0_g3~~TRINITY_DN2610_c0_g3_i1.p1  ORF type:complete len:156 (+),score=18.61 TRINITY_DN2610_c0_g3_i1:82-549(+)
MPAFSKVRLVGNVDVWQVSTDAYHMLDILMLAFLVPAYLLLSGSALGLAIFAVIFHHVSHLTTDFESSNTFLNKFSTKSFSLHFHVFIDLLFSLQIVVIGFVMGEDMGVTPTAASYYRGLGYLFLASYPLTILRILEKTPKNPFVSFWQARHAKM